MLVCQPPVWNELFSATLREVDELNKQQQELFSGPVCVKQSVTVFLCVSA